MAIKNIIFDFGDVFINLDKTYLPKELDKYIKDTGKIDIIDRLSKTYEIGAITTKEFLQGLHNQLPELSEQELINLWNGMLKDFPSYRLDFLKDLRKSGNYRMYLLSNTNELHISHVKSVMKSSYIVFRDCFDAFYLSHEIGLRKPNADIYEFVLNQNDLNAHETIFIDDTLENVESAQSCGLHGWHLKVGEEDVIELHKIIENIG